MFFDPNIHIQEKSVHSPIDESDGLRILATRWRGRGLPASRYHIWMPNLGPSEELLIAARNCSEPRSSEPRREIIADFGPN
jgi:uncharacterized protein YeaO (DUF488 family)